MRLRRGMVITIGLLVLYGMVTFVTQGAGSKETSIKGASDSSGVTGTLALTDTLRASGISATVWEHPPVFLSGQSQTLLSIEPQPGQYPVKHSQYVIAYAKTGHHVIWVTDQQDEVLNAIGVKLSQLKNGQSQRVENISGPNIPDKMQSVQFASSVIIEKLPKLSGVEQYSDDLHRVFGAVIPVGKGTMTVWVVPSVFENQNIGIVRNFVIPWALINDSPVLIDEFGHGVEAGTLFQTVFGYGRQASFVFLLLSLILYLFYGSVRLGNPCRAPDDLPRRSGELLDAVAWHFSKKEIRKDMLVIATKSVKDRICRLVSCNNSNEWQIIDNSVNRLLNPEVQTAYHSWRAAMEHSKKVNSRALKKWSVQTRRLVRILNDLEKIGD